MTTDFGVGKEVGYSVAIQTDGKIVVAGASNVGGAHNGFALARYNVAGSLDTTFGIGGKILTYCWQGSVCSFSGRSVVIDNDGKILVAGEYDDNLGGPDFALLRYEVNGTLDTSFGSGGAAITDFGGTGDGAYSAAIQSDGKIVVAGFSTLGAYDFALARYYTDGSLDTSFGIGGKVNTDFGDTDWSYSMAIQSDGKIIAVGYSNFALVQSFAVARYNTNGSLDTTFGTAGKVTTKFGGADSAHSVAIQSDGRIVVAGYSNVAYTQGLADFALARYNTNGSLDMSFGTGGKVTTYFGGTDLGYSVAIQNDGKIVVVGDSHLARYNTDGSLDTTFGIGGKVTTTSDEGTVAGGYSAAIQSDGKLVVAGFSCSSTSCDFAVARYLAAAPAPTPTPTPLPGVGWPGLLVLITGLAVTGLLATIRRKRSYKAS